MITLNITVQFWHGFIVGGIVLPTSILFIILFGTLCKSIRDTFRVFLKERAKAKIPDEIRNDFTALIDKKNGSTKIHSWRD